MRFLALLIFMYRSQMAPGVTPKFLKIKFRIREATQKGHVSAVSELHL
jgi:hypothetical protein